MWHVGQRVVCVDDEFERGNSLIQLKKGTVYTIRSFIERDSIVGIRLEEVVNETIGFEGAYNEIRFKPLDEKRLDIFRAMLKDVKETEKV